VLNRSTTGTGELHRCCGTAGLLPQQPYSLDFNPTEKVQRTLTCIGSDFAEADLSGFLEENFTTVGVRKAIAIGHFHHSSVWTDELG
jgi:hypothetical protein